MSDTKIDDGGPAFPQHEKLKVLAELDGWKEPMSYPGSLPRYLTSYDAIIPLIQKQPKEIRLKMFEEKADRVSIMTTPEQLADALIKAVGEMEGVML